MSEAQSRNDVPFRERLKNLNYAGDCELFENDYVDYVRSVFTKVDDVAKQLDDVLAYRCGKA